MTRSRRTSLARENKKPTSGKPGVPEVGDQLRQLQNYSYVAARAASILGAFNPKYVTHKTRLLMRDDPDVAFALAIIRAPLLNLKYTIESRDPIIKAFVEHVLADRFRQLAMGSSLAIPFGAQVVEKVWKAEPVTIGREIQGAQGETSQGEFPLAWIIKRFKAIDHDTLSIITDPVEDDWIGVKQNVTGQKDPVLADRHQVALWSFRRQEVWGNLAGYPIFNQSYSPWYGKGFTDLAANRYFERKGDPPAKGRAHDEVTINGRMSNGHKFMSDQIAALRSSGIMVLPNTRGANGEYLFDFDWAMDDKRGDMFQNRIAYFSTQILRGMWITDHAATTGEVGSRAEAEVHVDVMSSSLETIIAEFVSEVANPQVVDDIVLFNFGEEALRNSGTRLVPAGISANQRLIMKDIFVALLNAEQMIADGEKIKLRDRIDAKGIARDLKVPLLSDEELEEQKKNEANEEKKEEVIEISPIEKELEITKGDEEAVADVEMKPAEKDDGQVEE
jgi:hypothetical protein